jgi:hypothetical protein
MPSKVVFITQTLVDPHGRELLLAPGFPALLQPSINNVPERLNNRPLAGLS